jgi:NAD(P)-dependent dehydrogenase (short-subunit alcohol dehydrogenase family)
MGANNTRSVANNINLAGKTCIVTGANSGLGLATAKRLVQQNAHVVCTVRNEEKGQQTMKVINHPNAEYMILELESFDSVRNFAHDFNNKHKQLNVLINNAGTGFLPKFTQTVDGYEATVR